MLEIWKEVRGYGGFYMASHMGGIKVVRSEETKVLKQHVSKGGYLRVGINVNGNKSAVESHKLIAIAFLDHTPCGMKLVVDHKNGIKTDNRACNLQVITQKENVLKGNAGCRSARCSKTNGSSNYVGVSWDKSRNRWKSRISVEGKCKHLGYFVCELEASKAYQNALLQITPQVI